MTSVPLVEFRNASVCRGSRKVLHDITFTIPQGEHTAIVGPNGAGKSSLIRLLTRDSYAIATDTGPPPVLVFGCEHWDISELRQRLGIVSPHLEQRFTTAGRGEYDESQSALRRLSGLQAVLSGFFGSVGPFAHHAPNEVMRQRARDALGRVAASHLEDRPIAQMSTGEARRVLIARALVNEPEALILDEPTSGLDVIARHRFMDDLREIARKGTTILLVTQHIEEIFPEIDRVMVLAQGRIVDDGQKRTVLRGEVLSRVFGAPVRVDEVNGYFYARPG